MNKKQTIAYWARLLITYSSKKILMLLWEASSKSRASFFIRGSKHLETIKALRLRRRAFICFSVFGTPDEKLALVFDLLLLHNGRYWQVSGAVPEKTKKATKFGMNIFNGTYVGVLLKN